MIERHPRVVIDTNVVVSALLWPDSAPAKAFRHLVDSADILLSHGVEEELIEVFQRKKFDRFAPWSSRIEFLDAFFKLTTLIPIVERIQLCRDIRDDKFLELALNGRADLIVTGDSDLLTLHPWNSVEILSPAQYLQNAGR